MVTDRDLAVQRRFDELMGDNDAFMEIVSDNLVALAPTIRAIAGSPDCPDFAHQFSYEVRRFVKGYAEGEIPNEEHEESI